MPKQTVRFGVSGYPGYRAETWKCWTSPGAGKRQDVYVTCRKLDNLKLSLHESGHWHVAFDKKQFPRMFDEANAPPNRFLGRWAAAPAIGDLTLACRIHVPWYAATIQDSSRNKNIHWIDGAPPPKSIEVLVFLSESPGGARCEMAH
jgi:hypothetical protein